jgi:hypothetical protein
MKTAINTPMKSKINYTGLLIASVGILAGYDIIPSKIEDDVVQFALIGGGALVTIFRTWFT